MLNTAAIIVSVAPVRRGDRWAVIARRPGEVVIALRHFARQADALAHADQLVRDTLGEICPNDLVPTGLDQIGDDAC